MTAQGVAAAQGVGDLPLAFFDALASSEEEAEEWQFAANVQRSTERARRRAGIR